MHKDLHERKYPYFRDGKPLLWENGVGDYVALSNITLPNEEYVEGVKGFKNPHRVYEFQWGIIARLRPSCCGAHRASASHRAACGRLRR
jgi:hypothetical protein